jgi:hypothetical protein
MLQTATIAVDLGPKATMMFRSWALGSTQQQREVEHKLHSASLRPPAPDTVSCIEAITQESRVHRIAQQQTGRIVHFWSLNAENQMTICIKQHRLHFIVLPHLKIQV